MTGPTVTDTEAYRILFQHSRDGVIYTAPDGRVFAANPAICQMSGRSQAELMALGRPALVDPADAERWRTALAERDRAGHFRGELSFLRADRTSFPAEITSDLFTDDSGERRTCIIVRDITARVAADAALRQRTEQLAEVLAIVQAQANSNQRYAREVNDSIVQGLVAAETSADLGHAEESRRILTTTSRAARRWIGQQLQFAGHLEPGDLIRLPGDAAPPSAPTGDGMDGVQ